MSTIKALEGLGATPAKPQNIEAALLEAGLVRPNEIEGTDTAVDKITDLEEPPLDINPTLRQQVDQIINGSAPKDAGGSDSSSKDLAPKNPTEVFDEHGYTPKMRSLMDHPGFGRLVDIFAHRRYKGSVTELEMIERHIYPLAQVPGVSMTEDRIGNIRIDLGDNSAGVLWSCHTDTVHDYGEEGKQQVVITPAGFLRLKRGSKDSCLGADDGTGVWLMIEMINAGVPGRYIFHFGEERGCVGSRALLERNPELLEGMRFAIAFDRMNTGDIIHHQSGRRCCSDAFVDSMARLLPPGYAGAHGAWTDTAIYMDVIPECTNISVGYYGQHGPGEMQDLVHLYALREAMVRFDASKLVCARDPKVREAPSWRDHFQRSSHARVTVTQPRKKDPVDKLAHDAGKGWKLLTPLQRADYRELYGVKHTRKAMRAAAARIRAESYAQRQEKQKTLDRLFGATGGATGGSANDADRTYEPIEDYDDQPDRPQTPMSMLELVRNYGAELSDVLEQQGFCVDDFWGDILQGIGFQPQPGTH